MSGHSHAKNVMRKKQFEDKKRSAAFGKLLKAISISVGNEPNPDYNPRLRSAIDKAKQNNVPNNNIERAIKKSSEIKDLEELILEAYGPDGIAILIRAVTDNKNRTIPEIKSLLQKAGAKWAESGSVLWSFLENEAGAWEAKFPQTTSPANKTKLNKIILSLEGHDDIESIITNISS